MSDSFSDIFPPFIVGVIIGIVPASAISGCFVKNLMRNQAIDAGVAKWYVNEKSGETTFKYLSPTKDKEGK